MAFETKSEREAAELAAPKILPALPCSDCKSVLRTTYFVMNERPVCPKCRGGYKEKVDRGTGSAAMLRAIGYGGGAAVACAIGFTILLMVMPFIRLLGGLAGIGIAMLVAKAIGRATGEYGGRRYQVLAVGLTYSAISLAAMSPVISLIMRANDVEVPSASAAAPTEQDEVEELLDVPEEAEPAVEEDPAVVAARAESMARADSVARLEAAREKVRGDSPYGVFASRLSGGINTIVGSLIILFLIIPVASAASFGFAAMGLTLFALGYGMKRAWDLTGLVTDYELSGPFRVGSGPIAPTIGV